MPVGSVIGEVENKKHIKTIIYIIIWHVGIFSSHVYPNGYSGHNGFPYVYIWKQSQNAWGETHRLSWTQKTCKKTIIIIFQFTCIQMDTLGIYLSLKKQAMNQSWINFYGNRSIIREMSILANFCKNGYPQKWQNVIFDNKIMFSIEKQQ